MYEYGSLEADTKQIIWNPVTEEDVKMAKVFHGSAAGPNGITPGEWNRISFGYEKILCNSFVFYEDVPEVKDSV